MKNTLITFCLSFMFFCSAQANNYPKLLNTNGIEVIAIGVNHIVTEVDFESITENIVFNATTDVMAIQIFNDKEKCVLQLPIMAKEVKINKSLIGYGEHKIGFIVNDDNQIYYANVNIVNAK